MVRVKGKRQGLPKNGKRKKSESNGTGWLTGKSKEEVELWAKERNYHDKVQEYTRRRKRVKSERSQSSSGWTANSRAEAGSSRFQRKKGDFWRGKRLRRRTRVERWGRGS